MSFSEKDPSNDRVWILDTIKKKRFDPKQGALFVISNLIALGQTNGKLISAKKDRPHVYEDLYVLWGLIRELLNGEHYEHYKSCILFAKSQYGRPFQEFEVTE